MNEVNIDSIPFGDSIYIIYYLKRKKGCSLHFSVTPYIAENEKYYQPTFRELFTEIENEEKDTISHCMIIAEIGLQGTIYRYNNYGDNRIYECGTTRGYA